MKYAPDKDSLYLMALKEKVHSRIERKINTTDNRKYHLFLMNNNKTMQASRNGLFCLCSV